ncbi:hypothetical protein [Clostridium beijerinckii]|uniref:hypothetical protein n=1 Tax=Clostridium beijerinckii TaxID=1520 RepID=UPI001360F3FB|nr:hypothetical protein [Clostridium beijerinckii]MZK53865.1 hypothetical protein [Clostridium beijerinckii]MZK61987.1 hypothetical protein [Clostridium beijerinckii]MZK72180.1 hypothetical protein [Clostridium beijerinckii]MZK77596.1 hypothetical protein [Clostridium beijerinckii]MZK87145.1 hypothetical protein [Clostridium beijerinckii]
MKGLKIIPHSTLDNTNIKDLVKALHNPMRYIERYNFDCLDKLLEEGKSVPVKKLFRRGSIKKLLKEKEDTDLLVLQNTFIYEIQITKENIEFLLLNRDLNKVKKIYSKYIDKIKFNDNIVNYQIPINNDVSVAEMVNREHFMFSLKTTIRSLEPLKYILDLKRNLKEDEMFIYQVIIEPLNTDWWTAYTKAYKNFKDGKMPKKFQLKLKDIFNIFGNITLDLALELLYCFEEIIFGADGVEKIDTTDDDVSVMKREKGLSNSTIRKGTEKGFETAIRGIAYSKSEARREFLLEQFSNCFGCMDLDNNLVMRKIKNTKDNMKRIANRELFWNPINDSKFILGVSELEHFLQLPQVTLQKELGMERLDFAEIKLAKELLEGYIPIGHIYGGKGIAYWSKIKDLLCLSKAIVAVKGAGKSKYFENYVYNAYKGGDCIIYFDYIENNQNAWEVAKHIPKNDVITLDLSKGFTFDYPELDINTIPKDDEYNRNIKRFASDYCMLMEKFINTINTGDAQPLTANMRNILIAACSLTFLAGFTDMYSIYKVLTNYRFRYTVVKKVKEMKIYHDDDFRFEVMKSLDVMADSKKGSKTTNTVIGTNDKADRVLDRFNALLRDSRTEEMLLGIDRNNVNFVNIFEQNKVVLVLMPEDYFTDYELKDIVMTYFLSRMKLAGQKRAALIKDREKRKVVHIMLDEIHQLDNSTSLMIKNIAEDRKFRTTYVFTCQFLKQFGRLWDAVKGTGCNFMLLAGCEKENFTLLKEEIGSNFELNDLIKMPAFHSLNIVRGREKTITTFMSKLPEELK